MVLAKHSATGRYVAIKYLKEELRTDVGFRRAFRTEAKLLSGLRSPHVTALYEYVEAEQGSAIVLELVAGAALREMLEQEGPTRPEAALTVLKGSLLGLAAAHGVGVVHRDYKPENVLVDRAGRSKLVDFGVAARTGDRRGLSGTMPYMAPELWEMRGATAAGDVYAATVTFYECLTGEPPFEGSGRWELLRKHCSEPVPVDRVPEEVRGLVLHGMAKDPDRRPQNAEAFLEELEEVAGSAYGPDWEECGQDYLAALAAALLPLAVSRIHPGLVGGSATLATTVLPGRRRSLRRVRGEMITGVAALAVAGLLAVTPGSWAGEDEVRSESQAQAVTTLDPPDDTGRRGDTVADDDTDLEPDPSPESAPVDPAPVDPPAADPELAPVGQAPAPVDPAPESAPVGQAPAPVDPAPVDPPAADPELAPVGQAPAPVDPPAAAPEPEPEPSGETGVPGEPG
ncbi:protein kinase [Streptomyces sp. NPDC050481]|uniref:protein kinase domain-containing protein n=1 Tax=Streptomyces sp. NPDC050481 TaxID=3365616 RepID=UPI0037966900